MKKIRIVTFHRAHNYGAVLQAYALSKAIRNLKYEVKIIDYISKKVYGQYNFFKPLRKNMYKYIQTFLKDIINCKKFRNRYLAFNRFIESKLPLTSKIYNIKNYNEDVDVLIAGSDQIWNQNIVGELNDCYTLNFGKSKVNRISYAASIGNPKIANKYNGKFENKLNIFNFLSVREETGKLELEKIIKDKKIDVVLDPVFLLTRDEWEKEMLKQNIKEKYIFTYVVEENYEYRKIIDYLSKKMGMKVITFDQFNKQSNILENCYTLGPQEFISLINGAEYVITTSFHATVFSLIFNKKFFVVPHKKTGSRVTDLLSKLKLADRITYTLKDAKTKNIDDSINYNEVNSKIAVEVDKSRKWLINAIEGGQNDGTL